MWRRASAALLLCCCAALAARQARGAEAHGEGADGLAAARVAVRAVAAGEAREARFVLGSRYGRSAPAPRFMSPRNDRFFMSSRYGKRTGAGGEGAQGERACRCGTYRARYTRRPEAGSTYRAG